MLAGQLQAYTDRDDVVVLGLPRGGVPVAYEVARGLHAALDVFIVRKLGVPGREELAMGAIASGGVRVLNEDILATLGISGAVLDRVTRREEEELARRERLYRGTEGCRDLNGKVAILVDDGIATGASMWSALVALDKLGAAKTIVAVPVAPVETKELFERKAGEFLCLRTPSPFGGVGAWYQDFTQTTDDEVRELLARL